MERERSMALRRAARWLATAAALAIVSLGAAYVSAGAKVAAALTAKTMCSCLFVEGRSSEACAADVANQGFSWVAVTWDGESGSTEARALRLRHARAVHRDGLGCQLL
jgi:hypothetical protein